MDKLLRWEPRFATGDTLVDFDHQVLFAVLNELHCSVAEGCAPNTVRAMLAELAHYFENHFAHEEAYMASWNYPGLVAQRNSHSAISRRFSDLIREDTDLVGLSEFVYDLLTQHILGHDLAMVRYAQERHAMSSVDRHAEFDNSTSLVIGRKL